MKLRRLLVLLHALAWVSLVSFSVRFAHSETRIEDEKNRFAHDSPSGLRMAQAPEGSLALHYRKGERGLVASITRFDAANRAAYQKKNRAAFTMAIERGIKKTTKGFRLRSRRSHRVSRVPALDLEFERTNSGGVKERVWMRMLFRHRFTVIATATLPASAPRRARRLARDFTLGLVPLATK